MLRVIGCDPFRVAFYYDEARTVGTDFKFPTTAYAIQTIDPASTTLRDLLRHPITDVGQVAYIKRQVADAFLSGGQIPSTQRDAQTGVQRETILRQMRDHLWLQIMGKYFQKLASAGHQLDGIPQSSLGDSSPMLA
jgi:hypothetical protein